MSTKAQWNEDKSCLNFETNLGAWVFCCLNLGNVLQQAFLTTRQVAPPFCRFNAPIGTLIWWRATDTTDTWLSWLFQSGSCEFLSSIFAAQSWTPPPYGRRCPMLVLHMCVAHGTSSRCVNPFWVSFQQKKTLLFFNSMRFLVKRVCLPQAQRATLPLWKSSFRLKISNCSSGTENCYHCCGAGE